MALINCPSCKNQFDNSLSAYCPRCGHTSKKKAKLVTYIILGLAFIFFVVPALLVGACFLMIANQ